MRRLKPPLKKTLQQALTQAQTAKPSRKVELWSFDEHRLGLQPVLRRVWAPRGKRPVVEVQPRYQWTYLYGWVQPHTGQTFWLMLPQVNIPVFNLALAEFARWVGAGPDKLILLVLDGAGWHTSPLVQVPEGIQFVKLPPYSPELQPAERLWPLSNEGIANQHFQTLGELEQAQALRTEALRQTPALVRSYTLFDWWPTLAA